LKKQADEINDIFKEQNKDINYYKQKIKFSDSILAIKDSIIKNYVEMNLIKSFNDTIRKRLDLLENYLLQASINNSWLYYSWDETLMYNVDLSQYYVRKDDKTGDIYFYRSERPIDPYNERENPHKGWNRDIIKPNRPRVTLVPIKL
jgi:hypothetical protein